jgi:hypothetical protein
MNPDNAGQASAPRRTVIKAGAVAGIMAVGLPGAAAALSVDGSGAFVPTGGMVPPDGESITAVPSELTSGAINVSWDAVAGATRYQVKYRIDGTSDPYTVAGDTDLTTLQVTGLTIGTTYQFVVVATDGINTSFNSDPVTASPRSAPGTPTNVSATALAAAIEVSWSAPASGDAPTSYEVRWSATNGSNWTTITGVSASTFTQTVSGLTNDVTYYFQVRGVNIATGPESGWSSSVSASIATPPAPVDGATTTSSSVTIFTDSDDASTGSAGGFTYDYSTDGGSNWTSAGVSAGTTSFTISGITQSSRTIKVRKTNDQVTSTSTVTLTRQTPSYSTGAVDTIVNPNSDYGVRGITFTLKGGTGGRGGDDVNSGGNGGKPGVVAGTFTLDKNETLFIAVGSGGAAGTSGTWSANRGGLGGTNPLGGYAGGRGGSVGNTGSSGGGGGGGAASVLRRGTTGSVTSATATTIVVAGGGGGGGGADSNTSDGAGEAAETSAGGESGTNGGAGAAPPNGASDDGGGGGGGGGGATGGWGRTPVLYRSVDNVYYYRGRGGFPGTNSAGTGVTTTTNGTDSASLVNGADGSASFDYLTVTWATP